MPQKFTRKQKFTLVIVIIGFLMSGSCIWTLIEHYSAKTWTPTNGHILETRIIENRYESKGTKHTYTAQVSYAYESSGQQFQGNKVALIPPRTSSSTGMENWLLENHIVADQPRTVYYNPENIREAVLILEAPESVTMYWVFTVFLIFCSVAGIFDLMGKLGK